MLQQQEKLYSFNNLNLDFELLELNLKDYLKTYLNEFIKKNFVLPSYSANVNVHNSHTINEKLLDEKCAKVMDRLLENTTTFCLNKNSILSGGNRVYYLSLEELNKLAVEKVILGENILAYSPKISQLNLANLHLLQATPLTDISLKFYITLHAQAFALAIYEFGDEFLGKVLNTLLFLEKEVICILLKCIDPFRLSEIFTYLEHCNYSKSSCVIVFLSLIPFFSSVTILVCFWLQPHQCGEILQEIFINFGFCAGDSNNTVLKSIESQLITTKTNIQEIKINFENVKKDLAQSNNELKTGFSNLESEAKKTFNTVEQENLNINQNFQNMRNSLFIMTITNTFASFMGGVTGGALGVYVGVKKFLTMNLLYKFLPALKNLQITDATFIESSAGSTDGQISNTEFRDLNSRYTNPN